MSWPSTASGASPCCRSAMCSAGRPSDWLTFSPAKSAAIQPGRSGGVARARSGAAACRARGVPSTDRRASRPRRTTAARSGRHRARRVARAGCRRAHGGARRNRRLREGPSAARARRAHAASAPRIMDCAGLAYTLGRAAGARDGGRWSTGYNRQTDAPDDGSGAVTISALRCASCSPTTTATSRRASSDSPPRSRRMPRSPSSRPSATGAVRRIR